MARDYLTSAQKKLATFFLFNSSSPKTYTERFIASTVPHNPAFDMPPSLQSPSVLSLNPSCAKQICRTAVRSSRPFSTTHRHDQRVSRARRGLFRWLAMQGENFRNPLNGSTNYMGAYDSNGRLKRVVEANQAKARDKAAKGEAEPEKAGAGQEDKNKELPKETTRDRQPFPLNRYFISQPVLSEELREEIWSRIMKENKSVREVSAELKVDMRRVGAVVRLKEIEKEWKRIVSLPRIFLPCPRLYDDSLKNRLVFKTTTWLQTLRMRASLKVLTMHLLL